MDPKLAALERVVDGLRRKVDALERRTVAETHEVHTVLSGARIGPPSLGNGAILPFAALTVGLVPLNLPSTMRLLRVSTAIGVSGVVAGPGPAFGMAIYRATARVNRSELTKKLEAEFVKALGVQQNFSDITGDNNPDRWNAALDVELTMDPSVAVWFLAFVSGDATCRWACPSDAFAKQPIRSLGCSPPTSAVGTWPARLTVDSSSQNVPIVALRSALGVHIYGEAAYD